MEEVMLCNEEHYEDILDLGCYAFQSSLSEQARSKKKERMKQETIYGIFHEGALASKLHILHQELFLGGEPIKFGGIASVATWPEFRRKGHVNKLFAQALKDLRNKNISISMLHPFDVSFYRRLGYELTHYMRTITLTPNDIPYEKSSGSVSRVTFKDAKEALHNLYQKEANRYNLSLNRDDFWWEHRVVSEEDSLVLAYDEKGTVDGYLLANLQKNELVVEELVYESRDSWLRLMTWVRNHDSMVQKIKMVLFPNDPTPFYLTNPRVKEDQHAYFMTRIVDVKAFFEDYPYPCNDSITIVLDVKDNVASWNNGKWLLNISEGSCHAHEVVEKDEVEADLTIRADIQSLAALWLNSQTINQLTFFQQIECEGDAERLQPFIVKGKTALLDFF